MALGEQLPTNLINQVNYVTDLWQDPCSAPWFVYVETAFPHALELFVAATTFGGFTAASQVSGFMEETLEGIADPGGYNLFRRGLRGARRGRFRNPLMDLPDRVARRAPGFRRIQGLTDNIAGKTVFTIYNLAERANLYWFLASKAREEFIEWTTALYQTQRCEEAAAPRVGVDTSARGSLPLSGWTPPYLGGPDYAENGASMTNGIIRLGGHTGSCVATSTGEDYEDGAFDHGLRLRSVERGVITETWNHSPDGGPVTCIASCDVRPGEAIQALHLSDGQITRGLDHKFFASGANAAKGRAITGEPF